MYRPKFNNTKLPIAEKRAQNNTQIEFTHTKSKGTRKIVVKDYCFFCRNSPGNNAIHEAAIFQVSELVRACAVLLEDTELVALEAKYHTKRVLGGLA